MLLDAGGQGQGSMRKVRQFTTGGIIGGQEKLLKMLLDQGDELKCHGGK